jgi:hypothetical protein
VTNDPTDPRNDPDMLRIPFIFVPRGDPPPLQWMAEHPDYLKVPAVMAPHGSPPPWPWGGARADPPETAPQPTPTADARNPESFVPPPARRRHMPGGQPWPTDEKGRDWPKDRWGRPMRPLWDYPPGVRAGEGVAPGGPGSIGAAEAVTAYLRTAAPLDAPRVSVGPALASGASSSGSAGRAAPAPTLGEGAGVQEPGRPAQGVPRSRGAYGIPRPVRTT